MHRAYEGRSDEVVLLGDVVSRRLRDVLEAQDWYQEMFAEREP